MVVVGARQAENLVEAAALTESQIKRQQLREAEAIMASRHPSFVAAAAGGAGGGGGGCRAQATAVQVDFTPISVKRPESGYARRKLKQARNPLRSSTQRRTEPTPRLQTQQSSLAVSRHFAVGSRAGTAVRVRHLSGVSSKLSQRGGGASGGGGGVQEYESSSRDVLSLGSFMLAKFETERSRSVRR